MDILGPEEADHNQSRKGPRDGPANLETIPMSEFRNEKSENLRKIHAQSSAETSGLGDSLQRIHTLSSTETSGYGDTVPSPTAPTPSPETANPRQLYTGGQDGGYSDQSPGRSPVHSSMDPPRQDQRGSPQRGSPRANTSHRPKYNAAAATGSPEFVSLAGKGSKRGPRNAARQASPPPPDLKARHAEGDSKQYHDYYKDNTAAAAPQDGTRQKARQRPILQRSHDLDEGIDAGDPGSYNPSDTPPLAGKHVPKSQSDNQFLGKDTESTWLKWSQARRTSFKRRLDSLEQRQKDMEKSRVTTPVRKARKESVMFVSPELEDTHLADGEEFAFPPPAAAAAAYNPPNNAKRMDSTDNPTASTTSSTQAAVVAPPARKARRMESDIKVDVKLSDHQLHALHAFWEHDAFNRTRWTGIVLSFFGFIFGIVAVTNHSWSRMTYPDGYLTVNGLWQNCSSNVSTNDKLECSIQSLPDNHAGIWDLCFINITRSKTSDLCQNGKPYWQNAVIGLLIFSVAFGFLATVLSVCGVCTTQLPKKIYYYHSAGEIYLICALSCVAALVVYPVAITIEDDVGQHSYGVGYGLGWGASFFFFASSVCLCLDDLVRAFARGLCRCCGRGSDGDVV